MLLCYMSFQRIIILLWKHVFLNKHELYSEKIIYSTDLKIAGSVDLIIKNTETNDYTLIDWKTNEKIQTSSYNKKSFTDTKYK